MDTSDVIALITQYANTCGIDPSVAIAQAQRESQLNPNAYNPNDPGGGAIGLMQFTSSAWAQYGAGDFSNAYDIYANLNAWCAYMSSLLSQFGGDYTKALQAYNGGPGNVIKGTVSLAAQQYASKILANAQNVSVPNVGTLAASSGDYSYDNSGDSIISGVPDWLLVGGVALAVIVFMNK